MDWLCYQFVMWFPIHWIDPRTRFMQFVLPRAGNHAYRDQPES